MLYRTLLKSLPTPMAQKENKYNKQDKIFTIYKNNKMSPPPLDSTSVRRYAVGKPRLEAIPAGRDPVRSPRESSGGGHLRRAVIYSALASARWAAASGRLDR